jgi:hypothetical protein
MDRHQHWSSIYAQIAAEERDRVGRDYIEEAYSLFPRYNMDAAVLEAVETLNPDELPPFDTLRELLVDVAHTAASAFTKTVGSRTGNAALADERAWLERRFAELTQIDVQQQRPLPYRRVLSPTERNDVRQSLRECWGADEGYWYPLSKKTHSTLVAFDLDAIQESALQDAIKNFLIEKRVKRIYELRETGTGYEVDAGTGDLFYDGDEAFWTDASCNWIVYCSHERTVTLGGGLSDYVQRLVGDASTHQA